MARLDGKVAVVTGAATGIGRATARRLSDEGAAVVIADIQDEQGEQAVAELLTAGRRAAFVRYDASNPSDADRVAELARAEFGGLDVGVACAGIVRQVGTPTHTDYPEYLQFDATDWQALWQVNVVGSFTFLQACARTMLDLGRAGSLVAITSTAASNPTLASNPAYAVSKAAMRAAVQSLATKLGPHGIRVNAVGPGITATSMSAGLLHDESRRTAALATVPLGRMADPTEIANAVLFLASEEASFVSGETIYVDGGFFTPS